MSSYYNKAYFLLSVADVKQLPPDSGYEVAIVGRSNAGKSSVLNQITGSKKLARVSKTPGRTQLINFFVVDESRRLVDLPGYGYAKVPLAAKEKWQKTIEEYFEDRECLKGLILVMDVRHPLKPLDEQLLIYCQHYQLSVHILLNKADKLSKGAAAGVLSKVRHAIKKLTAETADSGSPVSVQLFSALSGVGAKELYLVLDEWYGYKKA